MADIVELVYDFDGRAPAAGRREVWIDPVTREWFLLTGDKDQGGSINQTKRKLRVVTDANTPPTVIDQSANLTFGEPT